MSSRRFVWLVIMSMAWNNASSQELYAPREIIVKFRPGVVAPTEAAGELVDIDILDAQVWNYLRDLGRYEFSTVCDGWRNLDSEETYYDILGEPILHPLVDFTNVYLIRYESVVVDAFTAAGTLRHMRDQIEYAHPNWNLPAYL